MRRRTLVGIALVVGLVPAAQAGGQTTELGIWVGPFSEQGAFDQAPPQTPEDSMRFPTASSAVVLPDGRILYWNGLSGLEDAEYPLIADASRVARNAESRVLDLSDPESPTWVVPTPEDGGSHDMFCADQRLLADGRVIVAGGTVWRSDPVDLHRDAPKLAQAFEDTTGMPAPSLHAELFGSNATRFFDHASDEWAVSDDPMHHGRWYPSLLTLPSGKLLVAGGVEKLLFNNSGTNVHETEIFDPETSTWTETGPDGSTTLPLFARLHLLPSGKVFYGGVGQMWSPAGQAYDQALWNVHKAYDPSDPEGAWTPTGIGAFGARSGAFSVMLPLRPDPDGGYGEARILVAGGTLGTSPGSYVAHDLTEVITVRETEEGTASSSEIGPSLDNARWYSSGVLLPDGSVVAVSGGDRDEVILPQSEGPVRQPELYDPVSNAWTPLASSSRDRTYHNTALLLADGSVLVGGHAPINAGYGPKGEPSPADGILANNLKDPSFEILRPPYLDAGPRPSTTSADAGMGWGAPYTVGVDDASPQAANKVVLVRLPSVTHITDADMRAVELDFARGDGELVVSSPPDGRIAPPGFYYLFVMSAEGVPSKARIVKVGPTPDDSTQAPAPMGI